MSTLSASFLQTLICLDVSEYAYTHLGLVKSAVFNKALKSVGTEIKVQDNGTVFIRTSLNNPEVDRWRLSIAKLLAEKSVRKANVTEIIRDRIKAETPSMDGAHSFSQESLTIFYFFLCVPQVQLANLYALLLVSAEVIPDHNYKQVMTELASCDNGKDCAVPCFFLL